MHHLCCESYLTSACMFRNLLLSCMIKVIQHTRHIASLRFRLTLSLTHTHTRTHTRTKNIRHHIETLTENQALTEKHNYSKVSTPISTTVDSRSQNQNSFSQKNYLKCAGKKSVYTSRQEQAVPLKSMH